MRTRALGEGHCFICTWCLVLSVAQWRKVSKILKYKYEVLFLLLCVSYLFIPVSLHCFCRLTFFQCLSLFQSPSCFYNRFPNSLIMPPPLLYACGHAVPTRARAGFFSTFRSFLRRNSQRTNYETNQLCEDCRVWQDQSYSSDSTSQQSSPQHSADGAPSFKYITNPTQQRSAPPARGAAETLRLIGLRGDATSIFAIADLQSAQITSARTPAEPVRQLSLSDREALYRQQRELYDLTHYYNMIHEVELHRTADFAAGPLSCPECLQRQQEMADPGSVSRRRGNIRDVSPRTVVTPSASESAQSPSWAGLGFGNGVLPTTTPMRNDWAPSSPSPRSEIMQFSDFIELAQQREQQQYFSALQAASGSDYSWSVFDDDEFTARFDLAAHIEINLGYIEPGDEPLHGSHFANTSLRSPQPRLNLRVSAIFRELTKQTTESESETEETKDDGSENPDVDSETSCDDPPEPKRDGGSGGAGAAGAISQTQSTDATETSNDSHTNDPQGSYEQYEVDLAASIALPEFTTAELETLLFPAESFDERVWQTRIKALEERIDRLYPRAEAVESGISASEKTKREAFLQSKGINATSFSESWRDRTTVIKKPIMGNTNIVVRMSLLPAAEQNEDYDGDDDAESSDCSSSDFGHVGTAVVVPVHRLSSPIPDNDPVVEQTEDYDGDEDTDTFDTNASDFAYVGTRTGVPIHRLSSWVPDSDLLLDPVLIQALSEIETDDNSLSLPRRASARLVRTQVQFSLPVRPRRNSDPSGVNTSRQIMQNNNSAPTEIDAFSAYYCTQFVAAPSNPAHIPLPPSPRIRLSPHSTEGMAAIARIRSFYCIPHGQPLTLTASLFPRLGQNMFSTYYYRPGPRPSRRRRRIMVEETVFTEHPLHVGRDQLRTRFEINVLLERIDMTELAIYEGVYQSSFSDDSSDEDGGVPADVSETIPEHTDETPRPVTPEPAQVSPTDVTAFDSGVYEAPDDIWESIPIESLEEGAEELFEQWDGEYQNSQNTPFTDATTSAATNYRRQEVSVSGRTAQTSSVEDGLLVQYTCPNGGEHQLKHRPERRSRLRQEVVRDDSF